MQDRQVSIALSCDEVFVLFELLARLNSSKREEIAFEHQAEQQVLWDLESTLEKVVDEIFDPDYQRSLDAARERVSTGPLVGYLSPARQTRPGERRRHA